MTPDRTHVRRWYAACAALGIPWWLFLPGHLRLVAGGYFLAWIAALLATPKVNGRRRLLGVAMSLALTFGLWLALLLALARFVGDAESQGPP